MEGNVQDGADTTSMEQRIGCVLLQEAALREDNAPVAAISHEHERRGPAQKLSSSDTAKCGERCMVISRGGCCSRVSNVFLVRDHCGPHILIVGALFTWAIYTQGQLLL